VPSQGSALRSCATIASARAALGIGKVLNSESYFRLSEGKQDDRPATGVAEALELYVITIR
jgi:hypothetical protein